MAKSNAKHVTVSVMPLCDQISYHISMRDFDDLEFEYDIDNEECREERDVATLTDPLPPTVIVHHLPPIYIGSVNVHSPHFSLLFVIP